MSMSHFICSFKWHHNSIAPKSFTASFLNYVFKLSDRNCRAMEQSVHCVKSNLLQNFSIDQGKLMCRMCLNGTALGPYGSDFELFLYLFVYPPLILFGLIGNSINLFILLSALMRSRANDLLSALALNDIFFLLLNIPHSAINFPQIRGDKWWRNAYFRIQHNSWGLTCWASASATWQVVFLKNFVMDNFKHSQIFFILLSRLVVAVCIERLIGIRHPLRAWASKSRAKTNSFLIVLIITMSMGLVTLYHHFEMDCRCCFYISEIYWALNTVFSLLAPPPHE